MKSLRITLLSFLLLSIMPFQAQDIRSYEYWLDSDDGSRTVVATAEKNISFTLPLEDLSTGIHFLNFRATNSEGQVGNISRHLFYLPPAREADPVLTAYEYWFDCDTEHTCTASAAGTAIVSIDITRLETGIHFLNLRALGDRQVGNVSRHLFYIPPTREADPDLTAYEYWFDSDTEHTYTASAAGTALASIDITRLETGIHFLNLRALGDRQVGNVSRHLFYLPRWNVTALEIAQYEYWIDNDTVNKAVVAERGTAVELNLSTVPLTEGRHTLSLHAQNTQGEWGPTYVVELTPDNWNNGVLDIGDWRILQETYARMDGDHWPRHWTFGDSPVETPPLEGVTVGHGGHAVTLNLHGAGIRAELPDVIGDLPALQELDLTDNAIGGNLGVLATIPTLTAVRATGNRLTDVSPMLPSTLTTLEIGAQQIDRVYAFSLLMDTTSALIERVPTIALYRHKEQRYEPELQLLLTGDTVHSWYAQLFTTDEASLLTPRWDSSARAYHNVFRGQAGDTLTAVTASLFTGRQAHTLRVRMDFPDGDANMDATFNVLDIQAAANYGLGKWSDEEVFNFTAADQHADDDMTVQDVVRLVGLLLEQPLETTQGNRAAHSEGIRPAPARREKGTEAVVIYVRDGRLILRTAQPVAAFDIVVDGASAATVTEATRQAGIATALRSTGEGVRIIGYAPSGDSLPAGEHVIATLTGTTASVKTALLADARAHALTATLNNPQLPTSVVVPKGEGSRGNDTTLYDLSGRPAQGARTKPGVYVRHRQKVVIK